jgi:hypothetical protein
MGIGWYSKQGDWENTHNYSLSKKSIQLLKKIDSSSYKSSVRDYHTLNVLHHLGLKNFVIVSDFDLNHSKICFLVMGLRR